MISKAKVLLFHQGQLMLSQHIGSPSLKHSGVFLIEKKDPVLTTMHKGFAFILPTF